MKILAIPATNSAHGINKQLLGYVKGRVEGGLVPDAEVELIDINDYEVAIYSPEREEAGGIPDLAQQLFDKIGAADAMIISFAEHNSSYTAAWKNLYDWMSRIETQAYQGTKAVMLAASPGGRAGAGVLGAATAAAPFYGAELLGSLGIGTFYDNFDTDAGVLTNADLVAELEKVLSTLAS